MIFLTVGHQMPFDRLVRAVDSWAGKNGIESIFAQIGNSAFTPKHIKFTDMLDPVSFKQNFVKADIIISHAGTGTILTALELGKPILILPRLGRLMETRNDHQLSTAKRFKKFSNISVATSEKKIPDMIEQLSKNKSKVTISKFASQTLLDAISEFISN